MSDEVFAFEPRAAVETLWARRWTLLSSVAVASLGAYLAASLLPKTWASDVTVQVGRVQGEPLETPTLLVQRVNRGILQCDDDSSGPSRPPRAVTAQLGSPDFAEVTLLARGNDAEDVAQQTQGAADCIVQRHGRRYESARQRSAQRLGYLELELKQGTDDVSGVSEMLRTMSGNAANVSAVLLLQSRLDIEKQRLRDVSQEILKLKTESDNDAPTVRLSSSRVSLIWPKPVVMGVVGGGLALVLFATLLLLLSSRRSPSRSAPSARANPA